MVSPREELEITQKRFEQNGVDIKGIVFNAIKKNSSKSMGIITIIIIMLPNNLSLLR